MNIDNAIIRYVNYGDDLILLDRETKLKSSDSFINAIIGPRRVGKTSLMLLYKKNLKVSQSNKIFINGEDVDLVGITADDLDRVEEAIHRIYKPKETEGIYLFIDEVQNFPEWQRWLRTLLDQHHYKIFVSGSTSDLSLDRLHSELRGRAMNTLVLPFSFREYVTARGSEYKEYMKSKDTAKFTAMLREFVEWGGYPEVVKSPETTIRQTILTELYSTVIQRDLIERYHIRKTPVFKAFVNGLFGSVCRELSTPSIVRWFDSQGIKISEQTASNYVAYAQSSFLFFTVYPYSRKIKVRNTKPKLYVSDSGILGLFDNDISKKLENQVLVELLRRHEAVHYYKSPGIDIDFVLADGKKIRELIQVSYSINNKESYNREVESLTAASKKLKCDDLTILTFNEERSITHKKINIRVVPMWKWFMQRNDQ